MVQEQPALMTNLLQRSIFKAYSEDAIKYYKLPKRKVKMLNTPSHSKIFTSYAEALHGLQSHMTLMIGGFGLCGIPEGLIKHIAEMPVSELCCISNNAGVDDFGLGWLLQKRQI